jgi:prophage maintenance system killer protein
MDRLIEFHQQHAKRETRPHIEAAWLHHAFTQIHPFQDGNGRVARAIASLVFIKDGFFPLVVNRDDREKYIDSLESADHDDLSTLVHLFSQVQKRALTKAIGKAVDVRPAGTIDEALTATRDMLVDLGRIIPAEYLLAKEHAVNLRNATHNKFGGIVSRLTNDISKVDSGFVFSVGALGEAPSNAIRPVAEKLKYDPNFTDFHHGVVLTLKAEDVTSKIVVSFHGVGAAFRGLLVAVAYFQVGNGVAVAISEDVFRISYQEQYSVVLPRFEKWLEPCIVEGIALWRRTLV